MPLFPSDCPIEPDFSTRIPQSEQFKFYADDPGIAWCDKCGAREDRQFWNLPTETPSCEPDKYELAWSIGSFGRGHFFRRERVAQ